MPSLFELVADARRTPELADVRSPFSLRALFERLGLSYTDGVAQLIALLQNEELRVRSLAARKLRLAEDPRVAGALGHALLHDHHFSIKEDAATALGDVGGPTAVKALTAALKQQGDFGFRIKALDSLARIGDSSAVPALVSALIEGEQRVSKAAPSALRECADSQIVPTMVRLLREHPEAHVRIGAASVLGKHGSKKEVPLLLAILEQSEDRDVRSAAAGALGEIGDKTAVAPLAATLKKDPDDAVRWRAAGALAEIGDCRAVPALIAALREEEDWFVRKGVVEALGEFGDGRAVSALIVAMKDDEDSSIREGAATALTRIADARILPSFLRHAEEMSMPTSIISVLEYLLDENATSFPDQDLKDIASLPQSQALVDLKEKAEQLLKRREMDAFLTGESPDASTPIRVTCICGAEHKAKANLRGQRFACKKCGLLLTVHEYPARN